jgi:formylglycine-generating enzyme required for sulfatase activity
MKLVWVPGGTFLMGSPDTDRDAAPEEKPQQEVQITRGFYFGAHPVTVGEFRQFVEAAKYQTAAEHGTGWGYNKETRKLEERTGFSWREVGWQQTDASPVVNVTHDDAAAFCDWLSRKEGKTYELPTEAEWEYACRAGTPTRYHSGDDAASLKGVAKVTAALRRLRDAEAYRDWVFPAWESEQPFTSPVGRFKANTWGLFDMHGNVWQWCADGKREYPKEPLQEPLKDPKGPLRGTTYVLRGGSILSAPAFCRAAYRHLRESGYRHFDVGFRVVLRAVESG